MQRAMLAVVLAVGLAAPTAMAGEVPLSIAGFTLGRPIESVADRVIMETSLPVRYMENLHEVEIRPVEGFKSGLIAFGTCRQPPSILRIKLKYENGSGEFFEELLQRFKRRYGDPAEYMGDAFRVFISWKWSFTDAAGNRISLILQHNLKDEDEKMGNAVKLTMLNRLEDDARCFKESRTDRREALRQQRRAPSGGSAAPAWELYVPK
jgi:hypothetical protein